VTLTEAGELLLRMTHRVERDVEEALAEISQTHALQRGQLHLGGGMTVCLYILPRLLKKYRRLYPGVDLQVTAGSSEKILERVRAHEVDLGLLTLPVVAKDMEVVPVLKEEMVVVTAPGHPSLARTHHRRQEPGEVPAHPLRGGLEHPQGPRPVLPGGGDLHGGRDGNRKRRDH
jgi:DNA-binding transcriptional LysR family regulator